MKKKDMLLHEEDEESKFNMALASLKRIHNGLVLCGMCSFQHDLPSWADALDIVYREVSCLLNPDEEEECDEKFRIIEEKRQHHINITSAGKPSNSFYGILRDYEIHLRKLVHKNKLFYPTKKSILDLADKLA
jgi:hypothetical protein